VDDEVGEEEEGDAEDEGDDGDQEDEAVELDAQGGFLLAAGGGEVGDLA
jgi:hypothetical protein